MTYKKARYMVADMVRTCLSDVYNPTIGKVRSVIDTCCTMVDMVHGVNLDYRERSDIMDHWFRVNGPWPK